MDVPPTLQPDDVLRQPTRARLFALLRELARPVATEELAGRLGLHRSGIRVHLERLQAAGMVDRHRLPQPRGRPRDGWSISAEAQPGGERPDAYRELAGWLAASVPARPVRLRELEAAGRRLGRQLTADTSALPLEQRLHAAFAALGFQPRGQPAAPGRMSFALGNCPYRTAVRANQPAICTLHRGLTQGLLDTLAPHAALRTFEPRDPDRAGCLIEIDVTGPSGAASQSETSANIAERSLTARDRSPQGTRRR